MSEIAETLRGILADGIRIVNRAATGMADATRYKLTELDSVSRRREAISELGEQVYALFQAGVEMPEEALPLLTELRALEEGLETMRTERAEKKAADKQRVAEEDAARREQRAADKQARAAARQAEKEARAAAAAEAAAAQAAAEAQAIMDEEAAVVEAAAAQDIETEPVAQEAAPVVEVEAEVVAEPEVVAEETAQDDELMLM